ncbi:MAG: MBOAT family protein [Myxococcales bacterium]|nr:MBOAT family protein [Myxococcales bacterium]
MRFDSFIFPLFYVAVIATYWALRRSIRAQNALILLASYVFYGWWDARFLALIALSTAVDFVVARAIDDTDDERHRKRLLLTSLWVNLGLLGVFKYYDFFVGSAVEALAGLGVQANAPLLHIILPVGISFYTFQTLSYTIDVYRRDFRAERDWLAFAGYVAFFPQLVAGPIERATRLVPQFSQPRTIDVDRFRSGLRLLIFGLVKKVAVADNMAPLADFVFGQNPATLSGPIVFAGTLAFAMQIYADFSGYSDIARGTARLMGFELCVNFDRPYVALTPSDFWRRWHVSLSQWLRDYLYVPLGGNRGSVSKTYRNLMATMVFGGLWHGAAWNFVAWGFFHGLILCIYRVARADDRVRRATSAGRLVAGVVFFALTLYGWLLFRARSLDDVVGLTAALGRGWGTWELATPVLAVCAYFSLPVVAHHFLGRRLVGEKWAPASPWLQRALLAGVALYGLTHARASETAFIYFQF